MATVKLERVSKVYRARKREVRAVNDVSLSVADRAFAVLVGPSGCGKTTTLRLLAGLEEADAGEIRIGERLVNNVAPKDRDIAMVFQNYALYPHMTVFANMGFGLKMRGIPRGEIKQRVREVADLLGIEHLLDRKPASLSGGEQQRVAVGRAIVRRPQVFLFDEPLSNLDAKLRVHMRTELKSLHQKLQTTVIHVTHDQEEAMTLGDQLVIMKGGTVQQCGAPLEVYNQPANLFVAGFIGTPPMNFLDVRIEGAGQSAYLAARSSRLPLPPALAIGLGEYAGRDVVLGVRPEHLSPDGAKGQFADAARDQPEGVAAVIQASITVVEPLGDSINVHLSTAGGERIVARLSPEVSLAPGQDVDLSIDMSRVHLFAANGEGQRLN